MARLQLGRLRDRNRDLERQLQEASSESLKKLGEFKKSQLEDLEKTWRKNLDLDKTLDYETQKQVDETNLDMFPEYYSPERSTLFAIRFTQTIRNSALLKRNTDSRESTSSSCECPSESVRYREHLDFKALLLAP